MTDEEKLIQAVGSIWNAICDGFFQDGGSELEYQDFMDMGEKAGLLVQVPYDPDVHGDIEAEPGDIIYTHSDLGLLLRGLTVMGKLVNG